MILSMHAPVILFESFSTLEFPRLIEHGQPRRERRPLLRYPYHVLLVPVSLVHETAHALREEQVKNLPFTAAALVEADPAVEKNRGKGVSSN